MGRHLGHMLMPFIILGGILLGVFTVTESAAVAVIYGFVLTMLVCREVRLRDLPPIFVKAAVTTGVVSLLIAMSTAFGWVMGRERIPQLIAEFIGSILSSPVIFLLAVNICVAGSDGPFALPVVKHAIVESIFEDPEEQALVLGGNLCKRLGIGTRP